MSISVLAVARCGAGAIVNTCASSVRARATSASLSIARSGAGGGSRWAGRPAATAAVLIEQRLGGLAAHDRRRDRVRVLLVRVADRADRARQLHAAALLHDVRELVRDEEHIGLLGERDVV